MRPYFYLYNIIQHNISLALRLCRICSNPDNYKLRTNEVIDYLANRGYDKTFLKTQIQRASDIPRTDALANKPKTQTETTPFVITYNPALPNLAHIIHKHSNVLYSSDRCRNVFKNLPLVAYRRCKNISDILVRTQLTNSTDPPPVPFGATTGIAPPVPILNMAVINTLFILQVRPTTSNLISLVKLLMLSI